MDWPLDLHCWYKEKIILARFVGWFWKYLHHSCILSCFLGLYPRFPHALPGMYSGTLLQPHNQRQKPRVSLESMLGRTRVLKIPKLVPLCHVCPSTLPHSCSAVIAHNGFLPPRDSLVPTRSHSSLRLTSSLFPALFVSVQETPWKYFSIFFS